MNTIAFRTQMGYDPEPYIVSVENTLDTETINKIGHDIDEKIETYGNEHNGDFIDFDFRTIVEEVLDEMEIKYRPFKADFEITI